MDLPPAGKRSGGSRGHLLHRRRRTVPADGRTGTHTGSRPQALRRDTRELAQGAPRAQAIPHRSCARDAHAGIERPATRRVSPGSEQDSRLQLTARASPPATQPLVVSLLAWSAGRPHPSTPVVVALAEARTK